MASIWAEVCSSVHNSLAVDADHIRKSAENPSGNRPDSSSLFERWGWWGATTEDPRAYLDLPAAEFKKKHSASLEDIRQHWRHFVETLRRDGLFDGAAALAGPRVAIEEMNAIYARRRDLVVDALGEIEGEVIR